MTRRDFMAMVAAFFLGCGVFFLLGAVPSQTDFSGLYFQTNILPISITGNLTNWAKLSADPSGGLIWTNVSGVIKPSPGQTTNTLQFISGIPAASTNQAISIGTASDWSSELNSVVLNIHNAGTNQFWMNPMGTIRIGPNANDIWSAPTASPDKWTFFQGSRVDLGQQTGFELGLSVLADEFFSEENYISLLGDTNKVRLLMYGDYQTGGNYNQLDIQLRTEGPIIQLDAFGQHAIEFSPFGTGPSVTPFYFNAITNLTSGRLISVNMSQTNKFSVMHNGAVQSGGDTNQWYFKSVTVGPSTNATINVNGTDYKFVITP